jgi:hypothetical protein
MNFLPTKTASREESMTTHAHRPNLQSMLKAAMAGTIEKSQITHEASRQLGMHSGEEKVASVSPHHYSTEFIHKLAGAVGYLAAEIVKQADDGNVQQPGQGPGALKVLESNRTDTTPEAGSMGGSIKKNTPPMSPSTQREEVQVGKASTGMETNDDMMHAEQPLHPISNENASIAPDHPLPTPTLQTKQSAAEYDNLARLGLVPQRDPMISFIRKLAEDALIPSKIEAGRQNMPDYSSSEEGVPSVPSDVVSQLSMIGSNDAAINYKKREAKDNPRTDVNQLLEQPALSRKHDPVLHQMLDNAGKAGVKLSHDATKIAAARALLLNLQDKVAAKPVAGKKKESMGAQLGGNITTPSVSTPAFSG